MTMYSPVAPIHVLEQLHEGGHLGDYLLLLAHDVLEYRQRYEALIASLSEHKDVFIIMDNSAVELDEALSTSEVKIAAQIVQADCIVCPDVIGSCVGTIARVKADLPRLLSSGYPLMGIPQGSCMPELITSVGWLYENTQCAYWGIPRWIANELGSRSNIIHYINAYAPNPAIHLLGMSQNFNNDITCARLPNVMGIDSANPLVLGQREIEMSLAKGIEHVDRGGYWESQAAITPETISNIAFVEGCLAHV